MDLNRFKNYGLWVAIFSLIPLLLESFGINVLPKNYENICYAILNVLVLAGIVNNPTTENKGFLDDNKNKIHKVKTIK